MDRIKKAFSVFLAACMTLMQMLWNGAFVMPVYADTGVSEYGLYVGGAPVTAANKDDLTSIGGVAPNNGGTASYDPGTNTLYLSGVDITGGYGTDQYGGAIVYTAGSGTFHIEVTGKNTAAGDSRMYGTTAGILIRDPADPNKPNDTAVELNIAGGGSLTAAGGEGNSSCGINHYSGGTFKITGEGDLTAKGSSSRYSYGIYVTRSLDINCSGGTVTAIAGQAQLDARALYTAPTLRDGMTAGGSTDPDGSVTVVYNKDLNNIYKWFRTPFDSAPTGCVVDITPGGHMKKTGDSGELFQIVALGSPVTPIVFDSDEYYSFPEEYPGSAGSNISLSRSADNKQLTVSGVPAGDVKYTLPDAKVPAGEYDAFDLYVGGVRVTSGNAGNLSVIDGVDGAAHYDPGTNTLHLDGVSITFAGGSGTVDFGGAIVYKGSEDFNVEATGNNTVTSDSSNDTSVGLLIGDREEPGGAVNPAVTLHIAAGGSLDAVGGPGSSNSGIASFTSGRFTITGSGRLNAEGASGGSFSCGIYTYGPLDINCSGGAVIAAGKDYGIFSSEMAILNGEVMAKSTSNSGYDRAFYAAPTLGDGMTAGGSTDPDASVTVVYDKDHNDVYKWFRTPFDSTPTGYIVDIAPGLNMTKTSVSGDLFQIVAIGSPVTPIVFDSNEYYSFPEEYPGSAGNNISLSRSTDKKQLTVSGVPAGDVKYTLPNAKVPTGGHALFDLYVGGEQVTSENAGDLSVISGVDGAAHYDPDTNTLHLDGVSIDFTGGSATFDHGGAILYMGKNDFNIEVTGKNTVTTNSRNYVSTGIQIGNPNNYNYDLPANVTLHIADGGSLDAVGGQNRVESKGINSFSKGIFTITGGGILNAGVTPGARISDGICTYGPLVINCSGGTVNAAGDTYGIMCTNGMTILSGEVVAKTLSSTGTALYNAATLGEGVTAQSSTDPNGSHPVTYVPADNNTYKWFRAGAAPDDQEPLAPVTEYHVNIIPGAHITVTEKVAATVGTFSVVLAYGAPQQTISAGNYLRDVRFFVDDGYYFPDDYLIEGIEKYGLNYKINENKSLEIYGRPQGDSSDITIRLPDAILDSGIRYDLFVGGKRVTSENAGDLAAGNNNVTGAVKYVAEENTLYLDGATITGGWSKGVGGGAVIYYGTDDFRIVAEGINTIAGDNREFISAGLMIGEPLIFAYGEGGDVSQLEEPKDTNVTITVDKDAVLEVNGGTPSSDIEESAGIYYTYDGTLTVNGEGTLKAAGANGCAAATGIFSNHDMIIEGSVTVEAVGGTAQMASYGITSLKDLVITGGEVLAKTLSTIRDSSALYKAPTLGTGITAGGSTNPDGTGTVEYAAADNNTYKWFKSSIVRKPIPEITVTANDSEVGRWEYIDITVPEDATGEVWLKIVSEEGYSNKSLRRAEYLRQGKWNEKTFLPAGTYTATIEYAGDDKYEARNVSTTFTVTEGDASVKISANDIDYGGKVTVTVTVPEGVTGKIRLGYSSPRALGNREINAESLTSGVWQVELENLPVETYTVVAEYAGDQGDYAPSRALTTFNVRKPIPEITVTANDAEVGRWEYIDITVPEDATGEVWLKIVSEEGYSNNSLRRAEYLRQGKWNEKTFLPAGTYTATAEYAGDNKYEARNVSATFTVTEGDASVKISANDIDYGGKVTVTVTVPEGAAGKIRLMYDSPRALGNREVNAESLTSGVWQVELEDLPAETYTVVAEYAGDQGDYAPSRALTTFTVRSTDSFLQDEAGWHYIENGKPVVNGWRYISYNGTSYWYFFNSDSVMQTGWLDWNGNRYYLNQESDGWQGRMLTGWQFIDGKWYFFEPAEGKDQGRMYCSERNSEGYYLGADGAWVMTP